SSAFPLVHASAFSPTIRALPPRSTRTTMFWKTARSSIVGKYLAGGRNGLHLSEVPILYIPTDIRRKAQTFNGQCLHFLNLLTSGSIVSVEIFPIAYKLDDN